MLITLELNEKKVSEYNRVAYEWNQSSTDDLYFEHVYELSDVFVPYCEHVKTLHKSKYREYEEDYMELNPATFSGLYVCGVNDNHSLKILTDYKEVRYKIESPIYFRDYGVADNASQIVDYYRELCKKYPDYMEQKMFVILMSPIIKEIDTGWRWHKWGRYIGKFPKQCEYLMEERGIDMVYVFHIYEVEREG